MMQDPLPAMERLEKAFDKLVNIFGQYRDMALKTQAELQFELSTRNEHIRTLNRHIYQLQSDHEKLLSQGSSGDVISKALEKAGQRINGLEAENDLLKAKIDTLQNQQKADKGEVKDILSQLEDVFTELEDA